jgi:lathosterol oxidase
MTPTPFDQIETPDSVSPKHFGSGWISGTSSIALGTLGLGTVICFLYPTIFTVPELRGLYPVPYIRALLHAVLVSAFLLGVVSVCLRQQKRMGMTGIVLVLAAALLGGSNAPIRTTQDEGLFLGLDWFLLNLILYSAAFVPLERMFALRPEQPILRREWRTDLMYFFVSSLLLQVTTILTMEPSMVFFDWAASESVRKSVGEWPFVGQFAAILVLTDLTQYWVHRAFHRVPMLWRFHAVHHSVETMDWLAGSRLHLFDVALTRGLTYVPIYILGFSEKALFVYVVFVSIQATFLHANVRFEFGPLRWFLATPQFHHWHHGAEREAVDKNFAVHLPIFDYLFGTFHLPKGQWPASYGIGSGMQVPKGFIRQTVYPFTPGSSEEQTRAPSKS